MPAQSLVNTAKYAPAARIGRAVRRRLKVFCLLAPFWLSLAHAQSWQQVQNQPAYTLGAPLLLTDGSVMIQDQGPYNSGSPVWWKLTPDINGNYATGTWKQLAAMPPAYQPLYFASAVLADGRVVVMGGEYNGGDSQLEANLVAIYNPVTDVWVPLSPPSSWMNIGDAPSVVLPDGKFLLGDINSDQLALLDPATLTWSYPNSQGKVETSAEEGFTLLPDGSVFAPLASTSSTITAQRYLPSTGQWVSAGKAPAALADQYEIGPQVLRPDGTVFVAGATGHNAVYTPPANPTDPGTWAAAPDFPKTAAGEQLDVADGPAVLLPSGNVLVSASPGVYNAPLSFYEFDGTHLNNVPATVNAPYDASSYGRMLLLPTGQVLFLDSISLGEIYTPSGSPKAAWAPAVTSAPSQIVPGTGVYTISGTQFNGLSQAVAYGDDYQAATNYPLVRITNLATKHVFYARTHDHSTMGVATGNASVSTNFDVPANLETGASNLVVVANGIPSAAWPVNVLLPGTPTATLTVNGTHNLSVAVGTTFNFFWSSRNATSATSHVAVDAGAATAWIANALNGSTSATAIASQAGHTYVYTFSVTSTSGQSAFDQVTVTVAGPAPALSIRKTHAGNFVQGQNGASYSVSVSNQAGSGATSGAVTVTEAIPAGMTLTSMSGTGWACSGSICTRSDALAGGSAYPGITVTVNIATNAAPQITNQVSVSGGGSAAANASDLTSVSTAGGLAFVPVTTCRIADTRNPPNGLAGGPSITGLTARDFSIPTSACGIPQVAAAYSLNVTVVPHGGLNYLTIFPTGSPLPFVSTMNSFDGRIKANSVIVPAGTNGSVSVFVTDTADAILDINGYFVPAGTSATALAFYPLTPCRVADTRSASGPLGGPFLSAASTRALPVLSAAGCNIPAAAQAYSLNFTAVPRTASLGYLTAWPAGQPQPLASTLNAQTGTITANSAVVQAGTGGQIDVFATNDTDLIVDVNGYFAPPGIGGLSFFNLAPCRVFDTRNPSGAPPFHGELDVNVAGSNCGVPASAQGYVFNATVVPAGSLNFLSLWPQGQTQPQVSTLNAIDAAVTSNLAFVPSTNGSISAYASDNAHLILDISGYFAP